MIPVIGPARITDVPLILAFIRGLAEYEKLTHGFEATEERLRGTSPRSTSTKNSAPNGCANGRSAG